MLTKPRVALIHDWLTNYAGAEQVLSALMEIFPGAPIYTSLLKDQFLPESFKQRKIITSSLQKFSFLPHQLLFPYMGKAFEQFDLSQFDIVISSAHASAKGVITKPETLHICYCHTPTRYLWSNYFEYLEQMQFGLLNPLIRNRMPKIAYKLRIWDRLAADRVDSWIANSNNVAKRISKYYRADAEVIYPPVDTESFTLAEKKDDYFFAASRLIPYKKIDIIVDTFNKLKLPLKIAGTGPEEKYLKSRAHKNIQFMGKVSPEKLKDLYSKARAFIFAADEDFGIVPVEAMASGTPVIAYKKGGATETVNKKTGIFFQDQTTNSLVKTLRAFEGKKFDPRIIREYSLKFSKQHFENKIIDYVEKEYTKFRAS